MLFSGMHKGDWNADGVLTDDERECFFVFIGRSVSQSAKAPKRQSRQHVAFRFGCMQANMAGRLRARQRVWGNLPEQSRRPV